MASTIAVVPTLRRVATSHRLASPAITWRRRYCCASACGSSRVFTIGRFSVVSRPTSSSKKSARELSWKSTDAAPFSEPTLPAPVNTCRLTNHGSRVRTSVANGTARSTR
jgi:hypothetical protein